MRDILKILRDWSTDSPYEDEVMCRAADEIERLRDRPNPFANLLKKWVDVDDSVCLQVRLGDLRRAAALTERKE